MEIIKVSSQTIARIYKIIYDFRIDGSARRARGNHHQRLQQFSLRALMEIEFNINSLTDS